MAEFDPFVTTPEGNSDNDFEKLDPLGPSSQEEAVSSTQNDLIEDLYTSNQGNEAEAEPTQQPLLDFGQPTTTVVEPSPVPETLKPTTPKPTVDTDSSSSNQSWFKNIDPRVLELVYWRDPKKTGVVFGSVLVLLLSLALFSVLSVLAYLGLALLTVTVSFVIYKKIMAAVQKTTDGHPFKAYLEVDISLPEDKLHQLADSAMKHCAKTVRELRRLVLVEDLIDTLKFGLLLWVITYIGAWFNGMTLLILDWIGIFAVPKFYETYKVQIDQNMDLIKTHLNKVISQVKEKLPIGKSKKE